MQPFIERAPIGSRPRAEANEFAANLLNMVIKEGAGPRPRSEGGGGARCGRAAVVQLVVVVSLGGAVVGGAAGGGAAGGGAAVFCPGVPGHVGTSRSSLRFRGKGNS